jgi:hypothetical protein
MTALKKAAGLEVKRGRPPAGVDSYNKRQPFPHMGRSRNWSEIGHN